jgi:hypothetical protein
MASSLYKANTTHILPTSSGTTNATSVATAAADIFSIWVYNGNAAVRYLKIYNLAVAPTVGTSVPVLVIPLPPSQLTQVSWAKGLYLSTGLAYALTTGAATSDTAAVGTDITGLTITYSL